jgi:apolipoprotein N-acyltransferase
LASTASTIPLKASFGAALARSVTLAGGWQRRLIALGAGAVGALAMPPVGFGVAILVPLVAAVWLIDGAAESSAVACKRWASMRSAFGAGWWWGFGYFVAGLWWLGAAFLVDGVKFAWALPFGVLGLPAALALFPALGFALARLAWPVGPRRIFALAFGLASSEWLRCVTLTGFPWNELGMTLGQNLILAQAASIVGLHGLTIITVAIFAAPATLWDSTTAMRRWAPTAVAFSALAALTAFGAYRLSLPTPEPAAGVKLRLLQPNISQGSDFSPEKGAEILGRYLTLSGRSIPPDRLAAADVTLLIWPESAFPFILSRDPGAMARIADFLRGGAILATGAARLEQDDRPGGRDHYYNSIEVLDQNGLLPVRYDKHHLVPFGEYMPLQNWLDRIGITQFVQFPGGFDRGEGERVIRIPGAPDAIAMVCYEAIFPNEWGEARSGESRHATWLLNVTDDAWFGMTAGPFQHFAEARLRAVELGLPLVRVANTGISGVIDALGRILLYAPLGKETVLDGGLPGAIAPTWQSRWGSLTFAVMLVAVLLVTLSGRHKKVISQGVDVKSGQ